METSSLISPGLLALRNSVSLIELKAKAEPAHDLPPAFDLIRIELAKFAARRRARFESEWLDQAGKSRRPHDPHQFAIKAVENRLRCSSRGVEAGPKGTDELGPPQLRRRGHVRKQLQPSLPHDRKCAQLARRDEAQRVGHRGKHQLQLSTEQIVGCGSLSTVWNVNNVDSGFRFEQLAGQMRRRPESG